MRDYVRTLDFYLKALTDNPNPGAAEAIIAQIFFSGPLYAAGERYQLEKSEWGTFTSADEQAAAKTLEKIIALCPEVNLNCRLHPKYVKINYRDKDGFERLESESESLPTILPTYAVVTGYDYEGCIEVDYYYTPCTPLMLAALFNMPAVMKVLLNQPTTDVTVLTGEPRNFDQKRSKVYKATAYALAPMLAFTCKKMLHEAALKQFYRKATFAEANQKDALVEKYKDYGIKPGHVLTYMIDNIMERVNAQDDVVDKINILKAEILSPPVNNALASFLGDAKLTELQNKLQDKLKGIMTEQATKAPTITFTDSTEKGGGINSGDPGPSSSASIFSKLTGKKQ